jgi:hypothetical protein
MTAWSKNRFKSKKDGMDRAVRLHFCTACMYQDPKTWKKCPSCGAPEANRQYMASKAELKRASELILALRAGQIRHLKMQPRFDLVVEGVKITTYVADFMYEEPGISVGGQTWMPVVEDTKPTGDFMDGVAKLKIALFNALHAHLGITVRISRRS